LQEHGIFWWYGTPWIPPSVVKICHIRHIHIFGEAVTPRSAGPSDFHADQLVKEQLALMIRWILNGHQIFHHQRQQSNAVVTHWVPHWVAHCKTHIHPEISRNIQNFGTSRHISDEASLRWSAESPRDLPIDFHRGSQRWSYGGSAAYLAPPGSCGSNWWSLVEKVCWKVSKHLEKVEKVTNFNLESVNMCESVSMCLQILVPFQIFQVSNSIKAWIVNVKRHQSCKSSDIGPNCFCQNRKNEASHLRRWQPQQSKQPDRQSQTEVKWHSQSKSNLMKCTQSCPFSVTSRTPFCPTFRHSYMTGVRSDAVSAPASYSRGTADPVVNLVLLIDVLFPIGWLINRGVCLLL
jgi:hypothetical protein